MTRHRILVGANRTLTYIEVGTGPPVLLLHGALTNADDMALGPMPILAEHFRTLAFDRPGHGQSERQPWTDASPWRQAEVMMDAVRRLNLERPVVVGHAFGGAVAIAMGLAFPSAVAGVVALAPIVWPEARLELALFGPRAARRFGQPPTDAVVLPALWRSMFLPQQVPPAFADLFSAQSADSFETTMATGEDAAAIATSLWRSVAAYPRGRVPVQILAGDADIVLNNTLHGAALAHWMPRTTFTRLPGIGHMLHHFRADAVREAVHALLTASR